MRSFSTLVMRPIAYSYIRMSRPEQIRGDSLRRQLEASRAYAARHDLELDEMLDIGMSAHRGKHRTEGTLRRFLELVEKNAVPRGSYLIIENLDRLSREQVSTALRLFLSIIDAGVSIVTLSDGQIYSKATVDGDFSKLLVSIVYMARAHDESAMKSMRLAKAWQHKRERAYKAGGPKITARVPGWLKISPDRTRFDPIPDRVAVVRRIFEECANGIGAMTIARRLNQRGVAPFGRARGWHESSVKKILANDAVLGVYQPHVLSEGTRRPVGEPIRAYFPAIVDDQLFWQAAAARRSRRAGAGGRRGATYSNLFGGLTVCGQCGGPLHHLDKGAAPKGNRYFQCDRARRRAGCGNLQLYRYDWVEMGVFALMKPNIFDGIIGAERNAREQWEESLAIVNSKLEAAKRKQKRLLDLVQNEDDESVDDPMGGQIVAYRNEIRGLVRQQKELEEKIRTAQATVGHENGGDVFDRAMAYLEAIRDLGDPREVYRVRAALAHELKRVISEIVFTEDVAWVVFRHGQKSMIVFRVRPDEITGPLPNEAAPE